MLMKGVLNGLLEFRSNSCSWLKMKITTVVPPWSDINLHCISSISTLCLICVSNMHPNTLINCLINFKPLFRAPPLPMFILSILLSYQVVVLTLKITFRIRSNALIVTVSQIHVEKSISMTIADDLFALSEHILLIAFVIIPVLISWLDLQLGLPLACLLHSKEFKFE